MYQDVPGSSKNLPAVKFANDVTGLMENAKQECRKYEAEKMKAVEKRAAIVQQIEQLQETVQQKEIIKTKADFRCRVHLRSERS